MKKTAVWSFFLGATFGVVAGLCYSSVGPAKREKRGPTRSESLPEGGLTGVLLEIQRLSLPRDPKMANNAINRLRDFNEREAAFWENTMAESSGRFAAIYANARIALAHAPTEQERAAVNALIGALRDLPSSAEGSSD